MEETASLTSSETSFCYLWIVHVFAVSSVVPNQAALLVVVAANLILLFHLGSSKPTQGVTLKDKSSQPMSLHAILLIYLFLWVTSHYMEHEKPDRSDNAIVQ